MHLKYYDCVLNALYYGILEEVDSSFYNPLADCKFWWGFPKIRFSVRIKFNVYFLLCFPHVRSCRRCLLNKWLVNEQRKNERFTLAGYYCFTLVRASDWVIQKIIHALICIVAHLYRHSFCHTRRKYTVAFSYGNEWQILVILWYRSSQTRTVSSAEIVGLGILRA